MVIYLHAGIAVLPVGHLPDLFDTPIEPGARVLLPEIGGHDLALLCRVLKAKIDRIPVQAVGELIDAVLQGKDSLRCPVSTVSTGAHLIRVDNICLKAEGLCVIERDRLVA